MRELLLITCIDCILMLIIVSSYGYLGSHDSYVQFGPHDDTVLMGIVIDTWTKYCVSLMFLAFFTAFQTCREAYVYPWIMNNVYDDKTHFINDFSKREVSFIVNGNYISDGVWYIVSIWMVTSQIDFAIVKLLVSALSNKIFIQYRYLDRKLYILLD